MNKIENKLLEKLCIELRHIGCRDIDLPNNIQVINHILEVQKISKVLNTNNIEPSKRLKQLTKETKWLMEDLYQNCINYPRTIPYVKLINGQRRIDIINKEKEEENQKEEEAYIIFLNSTAKDLCKIIIKYFVDEKKKIELLNLLEKNWGRHLAIELDEIKHNVSKQEKEIIEDYFWSVF